MTKLFSLALLVAGLSIGCDYLDQPSSKVLTSSIHPSKAGIRFGGEGIAGYLEANIKSVKTEVIPYKEFVKVGDSTKTEFYYKVIVTAVIRPTVLNKESWPYSLPVGSLEVELMTKSDVVLSTQHTPVSFHIDGNPIYATVTFSGLTKYDIERLAGPTVAWVYSR